METEEILKKIEGELESWMNHSIRGMKSGNPVYFQGKITLIHDLQSVIYDIREQLKMEKQFHKFLPGEHVLHEGKKAEVVDTYASGGVLIRIGAKTYKAVLPGEIQLCGPDGDAPRGEEVRFG